MRKISVWILLATLSAFQYAYADKQGHKHAHETKSQGMEHMSDEGAANANSPAAGQEKGDERADERKSDNAQPATDSEAETSAPAPTKNKKK